MRTLMLAALLAACPAVVAAQSPADGRWTFTLTSPMGTVSANVEMKTEGETLTGTFEVNGASWPIEKGSVQGDTITFVLNRPGATMTYEMLGKVNGDAVTGSAAAMGTTVDWSMARAK
ncbi:MAG: hypothetical protein JNL48_21465 [Acidobacteria bacterium]|nr:hypothetical protein [Acidobacteriota bacterium]